MNNLYNSNSQSSYKLEDCVLITIIVMSIEIIN